MSNELKPCPFCGGPAVAVDHDGYVESGSPRNFVSCDDADCIPPPLAFKPEDWNARPTEDALRARVAELEAEVAALREAQAWISVDERLPNDPMRVVFCDPYEVGIGDFHHGKFWPDDGNGCYDDVVTHWMPFVLPNRPLTSGVTS